MSMESLKLLTSAFDFQDSQLFDIVEHSDKYNYYLSLLQLIEMKRNDNMETCKFLNVSFTIFIAFAMRMCIFVLKYKRRR